MFLRCILNYFKKTPRFRLGSHGELRLKNLELSGCYYSLVAQFNIRCSNHVELDMR